MPCGSRLRLTGQSTPASLCKLLHFVPGTLVFRGNLENHECYRASVVAQRVVADIFYKNTEIEYMHPFVMPCSMGALSVVVSTRAW